MFPGAPGRWWRKEEELSLLQDEDVLKIAQKHDVSAGQVLIRYQVDKGIKVKHKTMCSGLSTYSLKISESILCAQLHSLPQEELKCIPSF